MLIFTCNLRDDPTKLLLSESEVADYVKETIMFIGSSVGPIAMLVLLALVILPAIVIPLDDRMWPRHKH